MDTIDCMRAFVAVAQQGSFTAGARLLEQSTNLVSKQVRRLEDRLGAQLLQRTTRSVATTDTGLAYLKRALLLLDQFDELEGIVQQQQSELAGTIRLTAPTAFGSQELIEAIEPFQQANPKVAVELHLADHHVSIVEDGFDLAVRFGALEDSTLMARKLMDMRVVVFAAPNYLQQHGRPTEPAALVNHNCLVRRSATEPNHWSFRVDGAITRVRVSGSFASNSPRAIANMALGGLGIGAGPIYVVEAFLKQGRLELLFEAFEASTMPLSAVYPPNRHLSARVRALIDHLAVTFASDV